MTAHTHTSLIPGCYRCQLNKDEVTAPSSESVQRPVTVAERCAAVAKAINEHPGTFPYAADSGRTVTDDG